MNDIIEWIRKQVKTANANGVVVAVSGGIDSAVVAALAKRAFPEKSLAIWIDIESSTSSKRNFLRTVSFLGIKNLEINLKNTFENSLKDIFETKNVYKDLETYENYLKTNKVDLDYSYLDFPQLDVLKGNIKARLRMIAVYAYAQKNNYLVLSTSNKSEIEVGYYTKWGDGAGDIAPISDLYKSEVYKLAKELKIPKIIIETPPSGDLWEDQTDENEMGFTYDELEAYLKKRTISKEKKIIIERLIQKNSHKKTGVKNYKNNK